MMNTFTIVEKAKTSRFYRTILNWSLNRMIPFNKPHGFGIVEMGDFHLKTRIPYKKSNFNHIQGLHACALATLSEFTTGFLLISNLDSKKYRIIMQRFQMDYHFQGKMDAFAEFNITPEWIAEKVTEPLKVTGAVVVECEVKIHDLSGNHLSTGRVFWQVKEWSKVKTKV